MKMLMFSTEAMKLLPKDVTCFCHKLLMLLNLCLWLCRRVRVHTHTHTHTHTHICMFENFIDNVNNNMTLTDMTFLVHCKEQMLNISLQP
jgi:hypothetical protein